MFLSFILSVLFVNDYYINSFNIDNYNFDRPVLEASAKESYIPFLESVSSLKLNENIDLDTYKELFGTFNNTFPLSSVKEEFKNGKLPTKINPLNLGVELTSNNAILLDYNTMAVLFEKGSHEVVSIASISKLMAVLVVLDLKPDFEETVLFSNTSTVLEGYRYIYQGERIKRKDLLYASLIGSDNTSLYLLANSFGIELDEFVNKMNIKAKELGLANTSFVEISGLDSRNVSTANDIAKLIKHVLGKPEMAEPLTTKEYWFSPNNVQAFRKVTNTNELLSGFINTSPYKIEAGKTGYIDEAGYCLTSIIKNEKNDIKVIGVVLGSVDNQARFQDLKSLVVWGFDNYKW